MQNGPNVSGMRTVRVGRLSSFHLLPAVANGLDVSEMRMAKDEATKVLSLTSCNAEWAICQWDAHGEGGETKALPLTSCNAEWPDVSEICKARGATKVLSLTHCNAEWARCQSDEQGGGRATQVLPLTSFNAGWAGCQRDVRGEEWGN